MPRWRNYPDMSRSQSTVGTAIAQALPLGAASGVAAYLVSYVVLFVFLLIDGGDILQQEAWKAAGWVFYGAHNVSVTFSGFGQSASQNVLASLSGLTSIPVIVYYLVPVVVLIALGYVVASRTLTGSDPVAGAAAGATVVASYLVLAILGSFLFAIGMGGASASPDLVMSVLLAGLAYPLVFGAVGGAIAGATN